MKVVSIFYRENNLKELIHELSTEGINNIHTRILSINSQQEVIEEVFISRNEKYGLLIGLLIGATVGTIISYLTGNDTLILPLFLRLEASGTIAVNFFWIMTTIILGGFLGALAGLAFDNLQTEEGDKMLIIYCSSEEKAKVVPIIERYDGLVL